MTSKKKQLMKKVRFNLLCNSCRCIHNVLCLGSDKEQDVRGCKDCDFIEICSLEFISWNDVKKFVQTARTQPYHPIV